jgi:Resolvase, N terminal domain
MARSSVNSAGTTANQERELREIADRMACDIVKVYKDHGISGAKGRDQRPAACDSCCGDRPGSQTRFGFPLVRRVER